jgi:F0F1-type ATP synthase assembly protein I
MTYLGAPQRGNDPLNVWLMAAALVAAACVGAGIGFLIDLVTGDEDEVVGTRAEP